ncbi:helicase [Cyanobium sp. WAJ14-Wanaka]|uniref:helicase n=1 Tax=Cyanobium sp. WAJ14-Wanaka TaxID=2823725 RepID=UPI0020CD0B4D|nr:helicase [Cyanobium sp. WAJ14-Wanaka]MCP9776020.1 helicase [Cyanobium sp. WAJ14-Wanaka]
MLEARAHHQLKALLQREGAHGWPHHLSMGRLVARSLRRQDHTLLRLAPGSEENWWISLLVPLALAEERLALVLSESARQRLQQVELPRLAAADACLALPWFEGPTAPREARVWVLSHRQLVEAWQAGLLDNRQLVIPEAEKLDNQLRQALAVVIQPGHWDQLRRAQPRAEAGVLALHERLSRQLLAQPRNPQKQVAIAPEDEAPLRHLLQVLGPLPQPWPAWLAAAGQGWTSWAQVDPNQLQWELHRQPLEPENALPGILEARGCILLGQGLGPEQGGAQQLGLEPNVVVDLGDPPLADPLPLFAPLRQPLPNSPHYGEHLLDQCRRLVLGQKQLSVVLLDDQALRLQLTSGLAAEFGSRVSHQSTAPDSNGVICASWGWWIEHQARLPLPGQLVAALLPLASLEDPLTAARVGALRQEGRDWFRERLLPDALIQIQLASAGVRRNGGRLAVLDGRLRGRSWGQNVFRCLEPWVALSRLLPH